VPRLLLSPRAQLDLEEIGDYIARDNPGRAISFLDELKAHCGRLLAMPSAYPAREDLGAGIRMAVHGRYLILFRVDAPVYVSNAFSTARAGRPADCKSG
jgi:toxin ParE1/3/4